ncbi:hypothetical protein OHA79_45390 (plasmid) [Streptomyces sp. NBC_00841]|nr:MULTISPECIES: hypothetical protein [unclassified Streptomyces]MCX4538265.1 hypothetical protein [Streptomyces sp. NBC_01669]WSA04886.1 hypothetical protein OHA79_45390 [Streptomyces sp. NBC_00841]
MSTAERPCSIPDDSVCVESDVAGEPLPALDPVPDLGPAGERPSGYEPL